MFTAKGEGGVVWSVISARNTCRHSSAHDLRDAFVAYVLLVLVSVSNIRVKRVGGVYTFIKKKHAWRLTQSPDGARS